MYIQKFKPDLLKINFADLNQIFMKAFRFKIKFVHLGFVCFVLYKATISGEHLQDHWSSGCFVVSSPKPKAHR